MCARYKLTTPTGVIIKDFGIRKGRPNLRARYNIAPSQMAPVVRIGQEGRELSLLRWGLVPSWSKDSRFAASTINARAETVADKPAFRDAFKARRCLVIADGFYEWRTEAGGVKQPILFSRKDAKLMAFAGLWERWEKGTEVVESFTIIVTAANELISAVHDRMPVIIAPGYFDAWLDTDSHTTANVMPLLRPYPADHMNAVPVSRKLNSVKNEGPELMVEDEAPLDLFTLKQAR